MLLHSYRAFFDFLKDPSFRLAIDREGNKNNNNYGININKNKILMKRKKDEV